MDEKKRDFKRRGKQSYKKLNMKDNRKKSLKVNQHNENFKRKTHNNSVINEESKLKTARKFNEFKASGLTLMSGKKQSSNKKFIFKTVSVSIIAVVLIFGILIFANSPTGVVEFIESKIALMKSGESFPVEYDFSTGKNIFYSNGSLLVVTETDLKCFNKSGNLIYSRTHGFADPIVKTSKIRTLVYGLNESHYRIETPEKEIVSKKTENAKPIICADISDCGVYALATQSDEDIALVTVFNKDGEEIYKYHSSNNYVTGVTVSENGKSLCVVSLTTKQAEFVSKITIFNFNNEKPVFEQELKSEVVYCAEYTGSSDVCVITDKGYINIDKDEKTNEIKYESEFLKKYEISDKYILLYNTADKNSLNGNVTVLSGDGDLKTKFAIEGNISDISVSNGSVYTLGEKINEYDFDGKLVKSTKIKNGAVKIKSFSRGTAVLYSSGIDLVE